MSQHRVGSANSRHVAIVWRARCSKHPTITIWLASLAGLVLTHIWVPRWFLNLDASVDPWVYLGTALSPDYAQQHFAETYYFRRWTLVFPMWIALQVFTTPDALFALQSVVLYFILAFSALLVWILTRQLRVSLLSLLLFASCPFITRNVGQTYHQGIGLLFFLAICLLSLRLRTTSQPIALALFIGLTSGLLLITYPFLAILIPALLFLALHSFCSHRQPPQDHPSLSRLLLVVITWVSGILFVTLAVDQLVARVLGVSWKLLPVAAWDLRNLGEAYFPELPLAVLLRDALLDPRLFIGPLLLTLVAAQILQRRVISNLPDFAWVVFSLLVAATYVVAVPLGSPALWWPWTNIYIAAVLIVSLGVALGRILQPYTNSALVAVLISLFAGTWFVCNVDSGFQLGQRQFVVLGLCAILGALAVRIHASGTRRRVHAGRVQSLLSAFVGVLLTGVAALGFSGWYPTWSRSSQLVPEHAGQALESMQREFKSITSEAQRTNRRVWLIDARPRTYSTNALFGALYGQYSLLNVKRAGSDQTCDTQSLWALSVPRSSVIVIGARTRLEASSLARMAFDGCGPIILEANSAKADASAESWFDVVLKR